MENSSLSHPLFNLIRNEHQQIKSQVEDLFCLGEIPQIGMKALIQKVGQHQELEYECLFSLLSKKERLREGGPMCTYFFDQHLGIAPLTLPKEFGLGEVPIPQSLTNLWKGHGPLCIPVSEHLTIQHLLANGSQVQPGDFPKYLRKLKELILSNFEKEEMCLFQVCIKLLSPSELDQAHQTWKEKQDPNLSNHSVESE